MSLQAPWTAAVSGSSTSISQVLAAKSRERTVRMARVQGLAYRYASLPLSSLTPFADPAVKPCQQSQQPVTLTLSTCQPHSVLPLGATAVSQPTDHAAVFVSCSVEYVK